MSKTLPHAAADSVCSERENPSENDLPDSDVVLLECAKSARIEPLQTPLDAESLLPTHAVARHLVEALVANGVDMFFGIPGGPIAPVFEALRTTAGASLVESRHESSAALAAVSYYRASGKVPCVVVTAGPGITNVVTGVASAYLEGVPMLLLCGDVAWAATGGRLAQEGGPQGIHVEAILAPVVCHIERIAHPDAAVPQVLNALRASKAAQRKAPALVVCPIQHLMQSAPAIQIEQPRCDVRVVPERRVVQQAMALLSRAQRPLLVLGGGCRGHEAAVRELVSVAGVPFITTPSAKGVVRETHPCSLRNGGIAASVWARRYTATQIDVAVVLGTDLDDTSVGPTPYVGSEGRLVHVDLDGRVFNRNFPTALAIQADLGEFARLACEVVLENDLKHRTAHEELRRIQALSPHDQPDFAADERTPLTPQRALADLERAVTAEARFITDIGEHMLFVLHYLTAHHPQRFHIQLNLGSMGSGIAGAIGLALGDAAPVVCICGDGGMQMHGTEILVAKQRGLRILYAVFNDGRCNMVHHEMTAAFGHAPDLAAHDIDFVQWADSMGIPAARVERPGQISADLLERLSVEDGPVLLDIRIDREQHLRGAGRIEALQHMSMQRNGSHERGR